MGDLIDLADPIVDHCLGGVVPGIVNAVEYLRLGEFGDVRTGVQGGGDAVLVFLENGLAAGGEVVLG